MTGTGNTEKDLFILKKAVESSGEAIFITDLNGLITYINPGFTRLYGYTSEDVTGKTTPRILKSGLLTDADYKSFWNTILNKEVVRREIVNKTKDGRLLTVEGSANPILNDQREVIGFIGVQHDITSRLWAEKELKLSEEKFRKAFMTSPDSINLNRMSDGMFISINEGFTNILGYTELECIGKTSIELNIWANPDSRNELVVGLRKNGKVSDFEADFRHKDGSVVNGLMSASILELNGVQHILTETKDITSRKRIDKDFAQEKFMINALLMSLPDHIYFKDMESRFIRNSKSHLESFGLTEQNQATGKSDFDFFTEQAASQAYNDEQQIIATGQSIIKEEYLTRKDQTNAWFSAMKMPLRDYNGNIMGTFGISRDITERKKGEVALKHSEERFRAVTESANDAIISASSSGIILGWNRGAEDVFGYKESEIIGKHLRLIIPDGFFALVLKSTKRMKIWAENHAVGRTIEVKGLKKDGSEFPLEMSLAEWETSEGKFFTGILRDITIRKRTEAENKINYEITQGIASTNNLDELLRLIHLSLEKIVYAENCFVALRDKTTGFFSFPYFVDKYDETPAPTLMGKSCTEYVFRTVKPYLYSDESFALLQEQNEVELVGSASPSWIGIPLQTPSDVIGVLVLQHYEKEGIFSEKDLKFLVSIGSQIAIAIERKKAEEEIKLKNELLLALNAEKDKFFSILAHDLRGPMSAFVSVMQILAEDIQNMALDEIREITINMKNDATNIYLLLENLLEWSRLRRGVMEFNPEELFLNKLILSVIGSVSLAARKKGIDINVSVPDNLTITADSHMIETVIRNLATNAVKFTRIGGNIKITSFKNMDNSVEVKIIDTGIGMSKELKDKLFMLTEKTSRQGTEGESSSGLGLLLCKEFIDRHNGKIWVESEEGAGSTFSFTVPVTLIL